MLAALPIEPKINSKDTVDLTTTAVALTSINAARKLLEPFFAKIVGAAGENVANTINDHFNGRRAVNLAAIVARAQERAAGKGLDPSKISLKVIHPMLEAASLEEDPALQTLWGNLLAKSADPTESKLVIPSFPSILKDLRAVDAKLLEGLFNNSRRIIEHQRKIPGIVAHTIQQIRYEYKEVLKLYVVIGLARASQLTDITVKFYEEHAADIDADMRDFDLSISIVRRVGIVEETTEIPVQKVEQPRYDYEPMLLNVDTKAVLFFSPFGAAFLEACLGPLPPE